MNQGVKLVEVPVRIILMFFDEFFNFALPSVLK